MYVDPNSGGMLFQVMAVVFTFLTGFLLIFSGRIRSGMARLRRYIRNHQDENSPHDTKFE
jgi:hypothetical protein